MKREIKFRGYHYDSKKWLFGYYQVIDGNHYIFPPDGTDSPDNYEVLPFTIGQLTDYTSRGKSPNSIYEGDIILFNKMYSEIPRQELKGVVIFMHGSFRIKFSENYHMIHESVCINILGNIHDHQELLT